MSKGIEDKLTVLIKETFMRIETENSCVQTKIGIRTIKKTYPSGITGLTEITELSDTLNYKPFFKLNNLNNAFYKLFSMHFKCVYLLGTKSFFPFFTFFWLGLGWHSVLQY